METKTMIARVLMIFCIVGLTEFQTIAYASQRTEYASLSLVAKEQNNLDIEVNFHILPSSKDRLILTSLSIDIAQRRVEDARLSKSTAYGWFIKENNKNQLWIGKVVKAGETQALLRITLPAMRADERQLTLEPTIYSLFISFEANEEMPAFLQGTSEAIVFIPITKSSLTLSGDLQIFDFKQWVGWRRADTKTFEWSVDKGREIYSLFSWVPKGERIITVAVALFSSFIVGLLLSTRLLEGLNPAVAKKWRVGAAVLCVVASTFSWWSGWIGLLVMGMFLAAALGFVIGPFLPTRIRSTLVSIGK